MSEIEKIIRRFALSAGISVTDVGKGMGVNQSTLSRWMGGTTPAPENWELLREFARRANYDIPPLEDVLYPQNRVEILGYIGAGAQVIPFDDGGWDSIELDISVEADTKAGIVRGQSMYPVFEDGDLVGFGANEMSPDQVIGRLAIVYTEDGRMLIKNVERSATPGLYNLVSYNAEPIRDVALQWARPFAYRVPRDRWRRLPSSS